MNQFIPDLYKGIIIKSRVRLARNIKGLPFFIEDQAIADKMIKSVYSALSREDSFNLYYGSKLDDITMQSLKEQHIVSNAFIENRERSGVLINADKSVAILINEEDVIREQCFYKGLKLQEAFTRLDKIDDALIKNLDVAFDERLGFLTACPTNLGTGMRASCMLFLPAIERSGKIPSLIENMKKLGMTVRGVYGEGSKAEGSIYQISNEITLGFSEREIISRVEEAVKAVERAERDEIEKQFSKNKIHLLDSASKSYGILTNAVLLSFSEYSEYMSDVKLGAMLGLIEIEDIEGLDELTENVKDAVISSNYGKPLTKTDLLLYRAEAVKNKLKKLRR